MARLEVVGVWQTESPPVPFLPPEAWRPIFTRSPPWQGCRLPKFEVPGAEPASVRQVAGEVANWLALQGVTELREEPDEGRASGIGERVPKVEKVAERLRASVLRPGEDGVVEPTRHPLWEMAVVVLTTALLMDSPGFDGGEGEGDGQGAQGEAQGEAPSPSGEGSGGSEAREGQGEEGGEEEQGEAKGTPGMDAPEAKKPDPEREAVSKLLPSQRNFGTRGGDPRVSQLSLRQLAAKFNGPLKRFLEMIGRIASSAWAPPSRVSSPAREDVLGVELGQDLSRVLTSELVRFMDDRLLPGALLDWSERRLLQIEMEGDEPRGRGPILIALDMSPSMEELTPVMSPTRRQELARMLCVALVKIGDVQNRPVHLIGFDHDVLFEKAARTAKERVDLMLYLTENTRHGNGTQFDPPLRRLAAVSKSYEGGDILFVTDGEAEVSPEVARSINTLRDNTGLRVFTLLLDATQSPLGAVSDVLVPLRRASDLTEIGDRIARTSEKKR